MDLDLSDDQVALRDGIAAMLTAWLPIERVRDGFDRDMFDELAGAGVFSLRADGFSWSDCAVVFEQLGRVCTPGPLVESLLVGGGKIAGIIERESNAWVEFASLLDFLIVLDGDRAARVDLGDVTNESSWPLDPCTPVTRVELPAGTDLHLDVVETRRAGATLTAAFALGLADRLTELSVAYAKERVQFDRPIAGFQAIKHLCADMLVRTEVARAAVYAAAAHLDCGSDLPGLDRSVSGAKLLAGEAAVVNGKTATQVHGGMGFTWEVDVHLFLKRAWVLDTHFGSADAHADVVVADLSAATA